MRSNIVMALIVGVFFAATGISQVPPLPEKPVAAKPVEKVPEKAMEGPTTLRMNEGVRTGDDEFDAVPVRIDPIVCTFVRRVHDLVGKELLKDKEVAGAKDDVTSRAVLLGCRACLKELHADKEALIAKGDVYLRGSCIASYCVKEGSERRLPLPKTLLQTFFDTEKAREVERSECVAGK